MENRRFLKNSYWSNVFKSRSKLNEIEEVLLSMPPFKYFTSGQIKKFIKLIHQREYSTNETIFLQGDPGSGLYLIIEGEVVIYQEENENRWDLTRLKKGDFFGELALLDDEKRSASAVSLTNSKIAVIFKNELDDFIDTNPKEGIKILRGIAQIISVRLRNLNRDYFELFTQSKK